MSSITSVSPRTLADVIPGGVARSVALVVGGAAFVGLTAQVFVPLPFSPEVARSAAAPAAHPSEAAR